MTRFVWLTCVLAIALGAALARPTHAEDWPEDFPREGVCAVCAMRGAGHGTEDFVDHRTFRDAHYGFCSENCAAAFDQMPAGYATPVLPREAPEFAWESLEGEEINPSGQTALLVDFWATWCAPCIAAMPDLESFAREFADDGLRVVGVSIDEKRETLDGFLARRAVGYPIVHDGGEDPAWWQFRVPAIPAAFLLDGQGNVVAQWNGEVDAKAVRAEIDAVLADD